MRLNNVVIAARDYGAMADFYRRLTDWPVLFESPSCLFLGRGKPHVVVHSVGPDTEVTPPEGCLCLDFEVTDLEEERRRLTDLGFAVERRTDMLVLRDPANNLIEITEQAAKG